MPAQDDLGWGGSQEKRALEGAGKRKGEEGSQPGVPAEPKAVRVSGRHAGRETG